MKKFNQLLILILIFIISGCSSLSLPEKRSMDSPRLASTEYFMTKQAKMPFKIVRGTLVSHYEIFLGVKKEFNKVVYLKVEFENPLSKNDPIIRYRKLYPDERKIFLKSPTIEGRESYTNYEVRVTIYNDKSMRVKLGEHRQNIRSFMESM